MKTDNWTRCYEGGWNGLIVPDAFSHPAKFSYSLTQRMFEHAIDKGWIKPGSVVVDPFGGVGTGGIIAAYADLQWIGCELEQKFVDLARENFELHRRKWEGLDCPQPVIIQGDSREMCTVLGAADCVISSPPFLGSQEGASVAGPSSGMWKGYEKGLKAKPGGKTYETSQRAYGHTPGQLGSMKPGDVDMVVSSPPYANDTVHSHGIDQAKLSGNAAGKHSQSKTMDGYGSTKGNLGNLKPGDVDAIVSSPPYTKDALGHSRGKAAATEQQPDTDYADSSPGQLGSMKPGDVDAIVSSPPYEGGKTHPSLGHPELANGGKGDYLRLATTGTHVGSERYGDSVGNIGNDKGPTFWEAAKEIVQQCHQILKPGGHAIWVVKAFVRKGRRVDFPGDWRRLCEAVGFKTVCTHHAMLVKETTDNGLFGDITEKKERKSFFRRLAESKGSPPIDFEVILCMEK